MNQLFKVKDKSPSSTNLSFFFDSLFIIEMKFQMFELVDYCNFLHSRQRSDAFYQVLETKQIWIFLLKCQIKIENIQISRIIMINVEIKD